MEQLSSLLYNRKAGNVDYKSYEFRMKTVSSILKGVVRYMLLL